MKLNFKNTFLVGLGFFTVSIIWNIYNVAVPIYLKNLGLMGVAVGAVMALDNVFAVIFQPIFGALSDKTNTRYGKRMPYLLIGIPMSAICFFLIPFTSSKLLSLMITVILLNFFMSIYRSPTVALMPDFTPSPLRSKANGIINFMGGAGATLTFLLAGVLFDIKEYYPFAAGSLILIITIIIMYNTIKEPVNGSDREISNEPQVNTKNSMNAKGHSLSLIFLLIAIFFWFAGFNAVETFFSTYGEVVLGIDKSKASFMMGTFSAFFVIFAIPAGLIGGKIGRKRTILGGLIVFMASFISLIFIKQTNIMYVMLAVGGLGWALININSYPMVVEMSNNKGIGKYTGFYYFFSMLASIISPVLYGYIKDYLGDSFMFIYSSIALLVAFFFMMLVKHGEVSTKEKGTFEGIEHME